MVSRSHARTSACRSRTRGPERLGSCIDACTIRPGYSRSFEEITDSAQCFDRVRKRVVEIEEWRVTRYGRTRRVRGLGYHGHESQVPAESNHTTRRHRCLALHKLAANAANNSVD